MSQRPAHTCIGTIEFAENRRLIPDSLLVTAYSPVSITVITPDVRIPSVRHSTHIGRNASYDDNAGLGPRPDGIPVHPMIR